MFSLDEVVPWGRSFDEYRRMFALSGDDLSLRILGCADGPASFNAEATRRGGHVVSCDPIYRWRAEDIRGRISITSARILDETRRNARQFVWNTIPSVEELGRRRMSAMDDFLRDYASLSAQGRYIAAELPRLPFVADAFDLALCSHLLFLYSAQLDEEAHVEALKEMCRVAREVRVFPLVSLAGEPSPHVAACTRALREAGYMVSVELVPYEFQRGGDQMMRVRTVT